MALSQKRAPQFVDYMKIVFYLKLFFNAFVFVFAFTIAILLVAVLVKETAYLLDEIFFSSSTDMSCTYPYCPDIFD